MTRGILVPAADESQPRAQNFRGLPDYQIAVGGWIEAIPIHSLGIAMYINEEGRLRNLPLNSRATFFWWFHVPEARQRQTILGEVVVVGISERNGAEIAVSNEIEHVFDPGSRFAVESRRVEGGDWVRHLTEMSYFDAAVWSMLLAERSRRPIEVKIISVNI
jgi:hypothetical protein